MSFNIEIGVGTNCTLYSRREHRGCLPSGSPGEIRGRALIGSAVAGDLGRDISRLAALGDFLRGAHVGRCGNSTEPIHLLHGLQRAIRDGDVVAIVESLRTSGVPDRRAEEPPQPRSVTVTPSRLFPRAAGTAIGRSVPVLRVFKLAADDGIAIWNARPGDILPDGRIAKALASAQPFELGTRDVVDDVIRTAGVERGGMYACDVIAAECKGSVLREFPSQYLNTTLDTIQSDARDGVKEARKALKLLNDNRFKK